MKEEIEKIERCFANADYKQCYEAFLKLCEPHQEFEVPAKSILSRFNDFCKNVEMGIIPQSDQQLHKQEIASSFQMCMKRFKECHLNNCKESCAYEAKASSSESKISNEFEAHPKESPQKPLSKLKIAICALSAYILLLPVLWWLLYEKDWQFHSLMFESLKTPELSKDVVLIDIPYPDKIKFRKSTGLFLRQLAQSTEMPSAVGLDILFKKFDAENKQSKEATSELLTGIRLLTAKGVPVIAGYDPEKAAKDYEQEIFDAVTDVGHNLIWADNGKFYAEVYEHRKSSSEIGIELVKFFAALMVKNGCRLGNDYIRTIEQKYHNILPIRYQKNFEFMRCHSGDEKASDPICKGNEFAQKFVIIGNFEKDHNPEKGFYGLHAIGYAVQMLADQAKGKEVLRAIEDRKWIIGLFGLLFSMLEVGLYALMFRFLKKFGRVKRSCLSFLLSVMMSAIIFVCVLMLKNDKLFADISVVISGILASGIVFGIFGYLTLAESKQVRI